MAELLSLGLGALSYLFSLLFVFFVLRVDYYNPIVKALLNFYSPIGKISIFSNQILNENEAIKPESLTAAGRGEFAPIATNETTQGKAKNRRIEVVLTPKLDEITKLLNND